MGRIAICKCKKCGNEFQASWGSGFLFTEYRCVDCDNTKSVETSLAITLRGGSLPNKDEIEEEEIGNCEKCGGKLEEEIGPMCPICKSREIEEKCLLALYD